MISSPPLPFEVHAAPNEDSKFYQWLVWLEEYPVFTERRDRDFQMDHQ